MQRLAADVLFVDNDKMPRIMGCNITFAVDRDFEDVNLCRIFTDFTKITSLIELFIPNDSATAENVQDVGPVASSLSVTRSHFRKYAIP